MTVLVKFEGRMAISWSNRSIDLRSRHPRCLAEWASTYAPLLRLMPFGSSHYKDTNKIYSQIIRSGLSTRRKTRRESLAGGAPGSASALKSLSGPVQQSRAAALEGR